MAPKYTGPLTFYLPTGLESILTLALSNYRAECRFRIKNAETIDEPQRTESIQFWTNKLRETESLMQTVYAQLGGHRAKAEAARRSKTKRVSVL